MKLLCMFAHVYSMRDLGCSQSSCIVPIHSRCFFFSCLHRQHRCSSGAWAFWLVIATVAAAVWTSASAPAATAAAIPFSVARRVSRRARPDSIFHMHVTTDHVYERWLWRCRKKAHRPRPHKNERRRRSSSTRTHVCVEFAGWCILHANLALGTSLDCNDTFCTTTTTTLEPVPGADSHSFSTHEPTT